MIGPIVNNFSIAVGNLAEVITERGLLPLIALVIEPGKILFLNNAMDHGVLGPLGVEQVGRLGQSIFFLLVTNPGPGLGVLLAFLFFGQKMVRQSIPGAMVIHFLGGIHEIYFPYVLMKPAMLLAVIAGGLMANLTFVITNAGLVATPSPGSIFALIAMTPQGGLIPVLSGVVVGTVVSFLVGAAILKGSSKKDSESEHGSIEELEKAKKRS